jgi:hypothetical protein
MMLPAAKDVIARSRYYLEESMSEAMDPLAIDPTIEVDEGLSPREVRVCPGCGMPEPEWKGDNGNGYLADDGHNYCCEGCALETGCTCV